MGSFVLSRWLERCVGSGSRFEVDHGGRTHLISAKSTTRFIADVYSMNSFGGQLDDQDLTAPSVSQLGCREMSQSGDRGCENLQEADGVVVYVFEAARQPA